VLCCCAPPPPPPPPPRGGVRVSLLHSTTGMTRCSLSLFRWAPPSWTS
jgi:hypothetical protein